MRRYPIALTAAACLCFAMSAYGGPITLTLLPSSSISGAAGSTVGWGYQITNTTSNWLETSNVAADIFTNGTPSVIFDFPVIAPGATVTEAFSKTVTAACPVPNCGLFQFTWNAGAPAGATNSGTFSISSEYFGTNPLTDPNALDLGPSPDATAAYTVSLAGPAIPEPSTTVLLSLGGLLMVCGALRRRVSENLK